MSPIAIVGDPVECVSRTQMFCVCLRECLLLGHSSEGSSCCSAGQFRAEQARAAGVCLFAEPDQEQHREPAGEASTPVFAACLRAPVSNSNPAAHVMLGGVFPAILAFWVAVSMQ